MITLYRGIKQFIKAFDPSFLDLLPRGKWSGFFVALDIIIISFVLFLLQIISLESFLSSVVVTFIMLIFFSITLFVSGKELEDAHFDIFKARKIIREKHLKDSEKDAYLARIEMELEGLRARTKRHTDSVEILLAENKNLKRINENMRRKKLELEEKLQKLENEKLPEIEIKTSDDIITALQQENMQIREHNTKLEKLNELYEEKNKRLLKEQKTYRNRPENNWMNFIPYATGDNLKDVKRAYRALAKANHPDAGGINDNGERIRKINEAFEKAKEWFKKNEP